jgi:hypothetical protein
MAIEHRCKRWVTLACIVWMTACNGMIGDMPVEGDTTGAGADPTGSDAGSAMSTPGSDAGVDLPADDVPVDFFIDIQPILGDSCVRCHGGVRELPLAPKKPLNLQSREQAARVLGNAGDVESSTLWLRVSSTDPNARMPLGGQALSAEKINKLRRWIFQGAPWPQHWAFAPIKDVQPSATTVSNETWVKTPIDRFILNRLDKEGLAPSPEADPSTLIRRLTLDLTGLPPTPQDVDAFLADTSATAYEKVVDRLLASPSFGERWARHWLDQARYADSDGYEKDSARPNAWRWRDWVIDSINQDQGFDQFTLEQIAGDLMPGSTPLQQLATGFHRNTLYNTEGGVDPEEDRTKRIIDRVATVGQTWLGLTLFCTQCHSHPYDNIKQTEFYQFYAFFNNSDEVTAQVPMSSDPQSTRMTADVIKDRTSGLRPTYLLVVGNFLNPDKSKDLSGNTPAVLPPLTVRGTRPDRLDLAHWMVDPKNPLTPRVAVNTIWSHLFGEGIVATLDDFGARSQYPSHPELLDWLASDFVKNGWKRKRLIKEIVMSATYRQSSVVSPTTKDSDNVLLHRQNRVRVEAEIVSDSYLAAAGLLSGKVGGPSVYPPVPPEILNLGYYGTDWPTSTGADRYRRGLYTFHKRTTPYPNLMVFDHPAADATISGRRRSNTPLQALTTLHDSVFFEAAQAFAKRVQTEKPGNLHDQIVDAVRLAVGRTPTDAEIAELTSLYNDLKASYASSSAQATQTVGSYLPTGVAAADAAAWVNTARVILNLDEVITRE